MKHHAVLLAALFLAACAPEPPPAPPTERLNPDTDYQPVSGEPDIDDIARFLAGRPVKSGAELSRWQRASDDYRREALDFDHRWRKMTTKRRDRQSGYYDETLRPLLGSPNTVFYPFGGPDLMYVSSLFPRADTYVLVGLEPVGSVPDLQATNPNPLISRLSRVMDEPLRHGYYVTEEMRQAPPVTPILLTTLGLMGARVDSVQGIDAGGYPGLMIDYRDPRHGSKRVIYAAADLSNRGMTPAFRSWLDQWSGSTAYFKAASYLMHDDSFSAIRSWVLGNSRAVLQDDSGIPHRYYDPGEWNATLLGTYSRPIPLFAKWRQDDLAAAYRSIGGYGPAIPFGSGYHLKVVEANYQVYTRK